MVNHKKILEIPLIIAIIGVVIGFLFRIMHWPYAMNTLVCSISALVLFYSIRFIYKTRKLFIDYVKLSLVIFGSIGWIFAIFRLKNTFIFWILTIISFSLWILLEALNYYKTNKDTDSSKKNYSSLILTIAGIVTITGVVFKILHWPYSNILIAVGIILGAVLYIKDIKND